MVNENPFIAFPYRQFSFGYGRNENVIKYDGKFFIQKFGLWTSSNLDSRTKYFLFPLLLIQSIILSRKRQCKYLLDME